MGSYDIGVRNVLWIELILVVNKGFIAIHGKAQETCPKNHGTICWVPAPHASSGIDE